MSSGGLLIVYCVVIVAVSIAGGWIPRMVRLTHRRLEVALSFVSGVMLGIGLMQDLRRRFGYFPAAGRRSEGPRVGRRAPARFRESHQ